MNKFIVQAYRADTGEHITHLDRAYDNEATAKRMALAGNCKAYSPFFYVARAA